MLLALPWGEAVATPFRVIKDCNEDGELDGKYSNRELRQALDNLPSDIDEYSDCREVIAAAITAGSGATRGGSEPSRGGSDRNGEPAAGGGGNRGGGGDTGGGGGAVAATPEEQAALLDDQQDLGALTSPDRRDDRPAVEVGGRTVEPGSGGLFDLATASNSVPLPLLLALIAVGLLALASGFLALRGRIPALARMPLLSKLPRPHVSLPRFGRR